MSYKTDEIRQGLETAFIDRHNVSNLAYKPQFISNDYENGQKVLSSIEGELLSCDEFCISVAFITKSGITPLLQTLKELEERQIPGRILTTDYLNFSEPEALEKLASLKNIELRMYMAGEGEGFHTKGYIFQSGGIYRIIVGSANMTLSALTRNKEWNTKVVSTEKGEYAADILREFTTLWDSEHTRKYVEFIEFYRTAYTISKKQRAVANSLLDEERTVDFATYKLQPNSMQVGFISNLRKIIDAGENRALLISATGTGKTYASAFAMREFGFRKVLFLVHRNQIAKQALKSFRKVFSGTYRMGLLSGEISASEKEEIFSKDYIFATIQTVCKEEVLYRFSPEYFDAIIYDEAHHSSANSYKRVMNYFKPKFTLGMTATPDKRDDNLEGKNIYEIYNYNIAYEIRLQQAMEDDLLCPFHYFGITDLRLISDDLQNIKDRDLKNAGIVPEAGTYNIETGELSSLRKFQYLTSDERVKYVMDQAKYYGHSGDRVKGLIFVSRIAEARELSRKFNAGGWRTAVLTGENSEEEKTNAIDRLVTGENKGETTLDYIVTVDLFSEGVDVPEINQVIMMRPTESPIVFIQQLGRGLRKSEGKEYVVVLDFIGNYKNNFMIPVALSGDRTYNADTIRKYVISGNQVIPGSSTIHFDQISKEQIFHAIDHIKGIREIIKQSYVSLKNRLGRIPYLKDFYDAGEVDPMLIIQEYKTYYKLVNALDKQYNGLLNSQEEIILEYYSKTILSGTRPFELELLEFLLHSNGEISAKKYLDLIHDKYGFVMDEKTLQKTVEIVQGHFVSKEEEYTKKYYQVDLVAYSKEQSKLRLKAYAEAVRKQEFYRQLEDIVMVGLKRYQDKYSKNHEDGTPFVLYEKYSRRDISLLMNCGRDMSSTMFGMARIEDDVFVFITYHKKEASDAELNYVEGKPDYADEFEDGQIFRWDSQIGRGPESSYVYNVTTAARKHLFVKKSDNERDFYYMGEFEVEKYWGDKKENNRHQIQEITKFRFRMKHPVREDLLNYFESAMFEEKNA